MNWIQILTFSSIKFLGIGDTGDVYLAQLVMQASMQLNEMNKILNTANMTSKQLQQAVSMTEDMQRGIDQVISPLKKTRQFKMAIERLRSSRDLKEIRYGAEDVRDYLDYYESLFPEKAKADQERRENYEAFEKQIELANQADLEEIERLENEIHEQSIRGDFSPGRANQISTQIQLKNWESQVLLREQLQRLMDENNTLREEVARTRRREEIQNKLDGEFVRRRVEKGWGDGL